MNILIREIHQKDNDQVRDLIRTVMTEFGAVGEGYSIVDPEVENMFEAYQTERSCFFVIADESKIYGCGGIGPLTGAEPAVCELKKMYFYKEVRGKGFGSKLLNLCLQTAREMQYSLCYLETLKSMESANKLYTRFGFEISTTPLGNTGHHKCNYWYTLDLTL